MSSSQSRDELKAKLNLETSRIHWHELQTYFARGQVVRVSPDLDLLEVATESAADNQARFEQWMNDGRVGEVAPDHAQDGYCLVSTSGHARARTQRNLGLYQANEVKAEQR